MIKDTIQNEINEQIGREFYSAYLYLAMAMHFESLNLKGIARWFSAQSREELKHAERFIDYLTKVNGKVSLKAIKEPPTSWQSLLQAFEDAYNHERYISDNIQRILDLAIMEKDYATSNFLQWFVSEQVEEEEQTFAIVEKIKLLGETNISLYTLDKELGQRKTGD